MQVIPLTIVFGILLVLVTVIAVVLGTWCFRYQHRLKAEREERASQESWLALGGEILVLVLDAQGRLKRSLGAQENFQPLTSGLSPGASVGKLLYATPTQQEEFRQALELIDAKKANPEVVFDLMDKELTHQQKHYQVRYRGPNHQGEIFILFRDVTTEAELAESEKKEFWRQKVLKTVMTQRSAFAVFASSVQDLFLRLSQLEDQGPSPGNEWTDFLRQLHTIKADARFFDFQATAEQCHQSESFLSDQLLLQETPDPSTFELELKKAYYGELKTVTDNLGEAWLHQADAVQIPRKPYLSLIGYIRRRYPLDKKLGQFLDFHRQVPLRSLFQKLPDQAKTLAQSLGKRVAPLEIQGGDFMVIPDRLEAFCQTFIHLLRNSLDHGIETVRERETLGKPLEGNLRLEIADTPRAIIFRFQDDGRGISYQRVVERARALGWLESAQPLDEQGLLGFLFREGFSTAPQTTEISGRGLGLAAVKTEIDKLQGSVRVLTRPGRGTTFEMILPWSLHES
ncbi:MAG: hypothetical protein HKM05_07560 [Spirochaetales bacterium]|nr:hypothetical protein [Spirochaetales bacterium]